jgi:hypothetical protein
LVKKGAKKGLIGKRKTDFWNEFSQELGDIQREQRKDFLLETMQNPDGISAERENFIHGLKVGVHKVLPVDKKDRKFINKAAPKEDQ